MCMFVFIKNTTLEFQSYLALETWVLVLPGYFQTQHVSLGKDKHVTNSLFVGGTLRRIQSKWLPEF